MRTAGPIVGIVFLTLCAGAFAGERTYSAEWLFEQGVPERLSLDGQSLKIERGVLVEDDGPAAGYSYLPNEEVIQGDDWVRKQLLLPPLNARSVSLLVARGGELQAEINGAPVPLPTPVKVGNYWQEYALDAGVFRAGLNEIVLHGKGTLWIAREDEYPETGKPGLRHPNRSAKSRDGGKTWDDANLGKTDNVDGEYYVRLSVDQHQTSGTVTFPFVDLGNLQDEPVAPPIEKLEAVTLRLDADIPQRTRLEVRHRAQDVPAWGETGWSDWQTPTEQTIEIEKPAGRFVQFQVRFVTDDPGQSPSLKSAAIHTATRPSSRSAWWKGVTIARQSNPAVVRSSIPFEYESYEHPRLQQLRRDYDLDAVVSGADEEWEAICRLAVWSSQRWPKIAHLKEAYPKWDALEILKLHPDGTPVGGFCHQYNTVFLQACESFGIPARTISIGPGNRTQQFRSGHEACEIWSNDYDKWVYIDGQFAWYAVDAESRVPLSMREVRERQMAHLAGKPYPPVELVHLREDGPRWEGLEKRGFVELRLVPRSNYLAQPTPLPLNQGMRGWFWTGHRVWADDHEPPRRIYSQFVRRAGDWEWTPNRVHARLIATDEPGRLMVYFDTETPSFKHFLVGIDRLAPAVQEAPLLAWTLKSGGNDLTVASVNSTGRVGPAAAVTVQYTAEKK